MKTQKALFIGAFVFLFSALASAQRYTKVVLAQRMSLNEVIVNYPVVTFDDTYQTRQWISSLVKSQANGSAGTLSNSRGNLFLLQERNDNTPVSVTAYMVFWSTRSHTWHIDTIDISGLGHLGEGVTVFSKK